MVARYKKTVLKLVGKNKNGPMNYERAYSATNTCRKMGSHRLTIQSVLVEEGEVPAASECIVVMSLVVRVHADLLQHRKNVAVVALANALEQSLSRMSRTKNCPVRGAYIPARLAALRSAFVGFSARVWHLTAGETPPFLQGSPTATRRGLLLLQLEVKSPCRLCSLAHWTGSMSKTRKRLV